MRQNNLSNKSRRRDDSCAQTWPLRDLIDANPSKQQRYLIPEWRGMNSSLIWHGKHLPLNSTKSVLHPEPMFEWSRQLSRDFRWEGVMQLASKPESLRMTLRLVLQTQLKCHALAKTKRVGEKKKSWAIQISCCLQDVWKGKSGHYPDFTWENSSWKMATETISCCNINFQTSSILNKTQKSKKLSLKMMVGGCSWLV